MAAELLVRALVVALAGFAPQGKVVHPGPDSGCAWGRDVNPGGGEKLAAAVHGPAPVVKTGGNPTPQPPPVVTTTPNPTTPVTPPPVSSKGPKPEIDKGDPWGSH